jgi:hypothetical protein
MFRAMQSGDVKDKCTYLTNYLDDKKSVYYRNGYRYNMKQLENSMETVEVLVGNVDLNISTASGAPIAIKLKWRLKCKRLG